MVKIIVTENGMLDLGFNGQGLINENTFESAVIISLLTDRRANIDDVIPGVVQKTGTPIPPDRRGWAGDALADDRIGSRLWLLAREKQTEETRQRAIYYAREALQWLVDDGHVTTVTVDAEWHDAISGRLNCQVTLFLTDGNIFKTTVAVGGIVYAV